MPLTVGPVSESAAGQYRHCRMATHASYPANSGIPIIDESS
ncbi:hypothetical protein [Citrobacter amalonaticus]|nr:hypothetical protein [Citrobacter amalonaticus]